MWQGVKSAAGREVVAPGQILWKKQFRFHNAQLIKGAEDCLHKSAERQVLKPSQQLLNGESHSAIPGACLELFEAFCGARSKTNILLKSRRAYE